MKKRNHVIVGAAFSVAAIAVVIDHTRHPLPAPVKSTQSTDSKNAVDTGNESPCGVSPCGVNPCGVAPCSLGNQDAED